MKQKKIILTGALVLALCLCLTACAGKRDSLGVISNQETGVKLTLGMTREEVEAALSPEENAERPEEACQFWTTNYGKGEDGIQVAYDWEADTVVQLAFGKDQTHWVLDDVVPLGAAQKEIEKQYGAPTFLNQEGNPSLTYNYNVDGVQTDGSDTDMILSFMLDKVENRISRVVLSEAG